MKQPWIHKPLTDWLFILSPPFFILGIVFCFQGWLQKAEDNYSFYTWLILVVFIDVAHVYATLFKTYFVPKAFKEQKRLLIALPVFCFLAGVVLFMFGSVVFWTVLAYVAVFHFIRQQYGFMRLYSRNGVKTRLGVLIDNLVIYAATGYPMLYWFMSSPRKFSWFMPNEFFTYNNAWILHFCTILYFCILLIYVGRVAYTLYNDRYFNIPKNAIIAGTAASWYFGIVYFNNDLIFTMLNIVSHGVPYMALVYFKEIKQAKGESFSGLAGFLNVHKSIFIYVAILIALAFSEEYLWEVMVWNEQFSLGRAVSESWHFLLVPLLVVPQLTHYILDGFIWKTKKAS